METVKNIAAIIGLVLSVISLITLCTKGGRAAIKSMFAKETKDLKDENQHQAEDISAIKADIQKLATGFEAIQEVSRQQCRNTLKNIYYKYQAQKKIPLYERKSADKTYEIYVKQLKGNSYATLLYQEICKWEIDTISYQDLAEED